ncbi:MAG: flagellar brake protein [Betaproteobacteria bacterium]|nr:flagellar brake protein [Betaproteobacteria bacterium]
MSEQPDQNNDKFLVSLQEDGLEEFLLRGHRQVRRLLQELINSHALISVHLFPGKLSFLSTIIALSENENRIFLDPSSDETIYRSSLQAERLLCATQLNNIRIQFRLTSIMEVSFEGRLALTTPIPSEILRLQRRNAFRLQVPLSHNLKCILPVQGQDQEHGHGQKSQKEFLEVPVLDLSVSGLSVEIPFNKTAPVVGDKINDCYLKLSNKHFSVDLEIRNYAYRTLASGKKVLRLGCSFTSLPIQIANQIQRYLYQIERELRTLEA